MVAFWHWSDFLQHRSIAGGKEPLFINLDETAVPMCSPSARGMLVSKRWWGKRGRPCQKLSLKVRRSMVTHVGLCTHRSDVQGRLPQIFIGNERCFTQEFMDSISSDFPKKVKFWRRKSSWNNSELMESILLEIHNVMKEFPNFQPILAMDAAKIHWAARVVKRAADLNIWLLPVPALCTWLLQPLDTHVFSAYKNYLSNAFRDSKDQHGKVSVAAWARNLSAVATKYLCGRTWQHSFEATGIMGDRSKLTRELRALDVVSATPTHEDRVVTPSLSVAQLLFPGRSRVPYWHLVYRPNGRKYRIVVR